MVRDVFLSRLFFQIFFTLLHSYPVHPTQHSEKRLERSPVKLSQGVSFIQEAGGKGGDIWLVDGVALPSHYHTIHAKEIRYGLILPGNIN